MKKHAERKTEQSITAALLVTILAVVGIGLGWQMRKRTVGKSVESAEVETTGVEIPTEEETSAAETLEETLLDDPQDDVPTAYVAYQGVVEELEATYGAAGSQASTQGGFSFDASSSMDLTGVCLLRLIDFNRDGLAELVAGYRAPSDGQYHFRVYGFSRGALHLYLDALMGGNGEPEVYELATERLNDGQIYLITHDGITEHRVYGFDATGNFVPLIEIGPHRINGQAVYDTLVQRAMQEWISDEQTLYPMTRLLDTSSALQSVQETKEALASPKPQQYTAKQLIEQIHDVTDDSIADYLYEDFDGDGVKDIVALSV